MKNIVEKSGITLITLVITVIVLLILAGVSISLVFDSDGLFKKASGTAGKYNETKAREALETVLMGQASIEKYTNKEYNHDDYLDNIILTKIENSKVQGDIVIVDGYGYELDRSIPKIGKYLGREEDLKFPEVTISTPVLADDSRTSSFIITAKEDENGISKIEVLQYGQVVQEFQFKNVIDTITQPVTVKRNGIYTIKVYSNLIGSARIEVTEIVSSVEFSPNGDVIYKKEHSTVITVKDKSAEIKSLKFQWTASAAEPTEESFAGVAECINGSTITGGNETMTGTYFLWILLETNTGKKNICGSKGFNFDNKGPEVMLSSNPESETSFKLVATANDEYSTVEKFIFIINDSEFEPENITDEIANYTWNGKEMIENAKSRVKVWDNLGNVTVSDICLSSTFLHTWEISGYDLKTKYQPGDWVFYTSGAWEDTADDGNPGNRGVLGIKWPDPDFTCIETFDPWTGKYAWDTVVSSTWMCEVLANMDRKRNRY